MTTISNELAWWITVVDLPAMAGLLLLIWRTRRDHEQAVQHLRDIVDTRNHQLRDALAAFKLEVAKSYASISDMHDLEGRLVGHLLRIEAKLDNTAMKTEALRAERNRKDANRS